MASSSAGIRLATAASPFAQVDGHVGVEQVGHVSGSETFGQLVGFAYFNRRRRGQRVQARQHLWNCEGGGIDRQDVTRPDEHELNIVPEGHVLRESKRFTVSAPKCSTACAGHGKPFEMDIHVYANWRVETQSGWRSSPHDDTSKHARGAARGGHNR